MDTQTFSGTKSSKYSLVSEAQYVVALAYVGVYVVGMFERFGGTLGITPTGRLEFTLQNGKILFSAPVSQMRVKVRPSAGTAVVWAGNNRYTLHIVKPSGSTLPSDKTTNNVDIGEQWRGLVEQHATTPADNDPIIVTDAPKPGPATTRLVLAGALVMTVAVSGTAYLNDHKISDILIALFLIVTIAMPYAAWMTHRIKYVKRIILLTEPGQIKA